MAIDQMRRRRRNMRSEQPRSRWGIGDDLRFKQRGRVRRTDSGDETDQNGNTEQASCDGDYGLPPGATR
jgi:hypothetical protein